MICKQCGTEIADKAIVCYRCGIGTTEPVRKAVEIRRSRGRVVPIVVLAVLALLALLLGWQFNVLGVEVLIDFTAIHA